MSLSRRVARLRALTDQRRAEAGKDNWWVDALDDLTDEEREELRRVGADPATAEQDWFAVMDELFAEIEAGTAKLSD